MHTSAGLRDLHDRTHRSLQKLLDHCAGFTDEELRREMAGFGYPNILLQLHHMIGAEQYWIGVLEGKMLVKLVIQKNGRPKRISVSPSKFKSSVVGRCVVRAVKRWRFPRFSGRNMPVDFPVNVRGR